MTEFLKDFNFVKGRLQKVRNLKEIEKCKTFIEMFTSKYVVQVSHMDPIFIKHRNELVQLYNEKFKTFSSCIWLSIFLWYFLWMGTHYYGIEMLSEQEFEDLQNYLYQIENR